MSKGFRNTLIILAVMAGILLLVPLIWGGLSAWQGAGWGGWGGMMGPGMMGSGFGGLMMIPMILFWGLIIWGIVWLVRGAGGYCAPTYSNQTDSALDILKKRYARGEINKEEFEARKKDLA